MEYIDLEIDKMSQILRCMIGYRLESNYISRFSKLLDPYIYGQETNFAQNFASNTFLTIDDILINNLILFCRGRYITTDKLVDLESQEKILQILERYNRYLIDIFTLITLQSLSK